MDTEHAKHIEGLEEAMMFNNMTQEIYENELYIAIVRAGPAHDGLSSSRVKTAAGSRRWTSSRTTLARVFLNDGKKPSAQKFYDYLVVLLPFTEETIGERLLTLSFKGAGLKTAARLNYLIKMRRAPLFAGRYKLTSAMERNKKGRFAGINVHKPAGADGWVTEDEGIILCQTFESLRTSEVVFDRERETIRSR